MGVPDTTTFTLQDVADEFGLGSNDGLTDCFDEATSSDFDVLYEGNKDELLNFRNYGSTATLSSFACSGVLSSNACKLTINQTRFFDGSGTYPVVNDVCYASNDTSGLKLQAGHYRINQVSGTASLVVGSNGVVSSVIAC
jgi:hypothetical protein